MKIWLTAPDGDEISAPLSKQHKDRATLRSGAMISRICRAGGAPPARPKPRTEGILRHCLNGLDACYDNLETSPDPARAQKCHNDREGARLVGGKSKAWVAKRSAESIHFRVVFKGQKRQRRRSVSVPCRGGQDAKDDACPIAKIRFRNQIWRSFEAIDVDINAIAEFGEEDEPVGVIQQAATITKDSPIFIILTAKRICGSLCDRGQNPFCGDRPANCECTLRGRLRSFLPKIPYSQPFTV